MNKVVILSFLGSLIFISCSHKPEVIYVDKDTVYQQKITVSTKTKKKVKEVVTDNVYSHKSRAKKIEQIVKDISEIIEREKNKTAKIVKKHVEKKYKKILTPYTEEKIKKQTKLLKEPIIPIKEPDVILRVLLLPYVDNNNVFHSGEYLFVKVEEGEWILGSYIRNKSIKQTREYNPLVEEGK